MYCKLNEKRIKSLNSSSFYSNFKIFHPAAKTKNIKSGRGPTAYLVKRRTLAWTMLNDSVSAHALKTFIHGMKPNGFNQPPECHLQWEKVRNSNVIGRSLKC
jgi:hypothetical protein